MTIEQEKLESAKLKVAKLLRLGQDGAASENEAETALRQAEALMRKYGIDRSQVLKEGGQIEYKWESGYYDFGRDGQPVKKNPIWYQWLIVAIANFTDTIAYNSWDHARGCALVKFAGELEDVVLALWFAEYLKDAVRRGTRNANMGSSAGREAFRKAMSLRLCARMRQMREERTRVFSTSTALVVVSDKLTKRDEHFGKAKYKTGKAVTISNLDAIRRGHAEAEKVQFNKPLSGANNDRLAN